MVTVEVTPTRAGHYVWWPIGVKLPNARRPLKVLRPPAVFRWPCAHRFVREMPCPYALQLLLPPYGYFTVFHDQTVTGPLEHTDFRIEASGGTTAIPTEKEAAVHIYSVCVVEMSSSNHYRLCARHGKVQTGPPGWLA